MEQVIQGNFGIEFHFVFFTFSNAFFSYATCSSFIGGVKNVTCTGNVVKTEHFDRSGRTSFFNFFTTVVNHCTNFTISSAGNDGVTNMESTALYQYGSYRATTFIQLGFNYGTTSRKVRVSFQFLHFSYQQNHFQQIADTHFFMCGNGNHNGIAAPIFRNQFMFSQLLFNMVRVCTFTVHFVNSNNDGHFRCFSMVDCFDGLRHYTVICSNNEDSNVSYLSTTSTHCGERFVTRGIKEYDGFALMADFVRTDVLGNTASFACSNIGFTDCVKQRSFTMVNVTHYGNYRRTQYAFFRIIFYFGNFSRIFIRSFLTDFYTKFFTDKLSGFEVDVLVNGNHHTQHEQRFDNFANFAFNQGCEFFNVDGFADFYESRSNDFSCGLIAFRLRIIGRTFFHVHLMTRATVRTAFFSSVGTFNLLFVLVAVFIAIAVSSLARFYAEHIECRFRTAFTTRLLRTALLRTIATTVIVIAETTLLTTRLLTFRTYKDTALTILLGTVLTALSLALRALATVVVTETALLALTLRALTTVVITEATLLALTLRALTTLTLTLALGTLATVVVTEATLLALTLGALTALTIFKITVLLGLIVSVTCILCSLFRLLLLLNRNSLLRLFFLHRRLLFFRKCFSNNVHFFGIYAAEIGFFDIVLFQNINDFIAAFADFLSNFVYSFTHSSTS